MPYRRKRIRRGRISLGDAKVYLYTILLCAVVAVAIVMMVELFTEKVPTFMDVLETEAVRQTAERLTGKKLSHAALKRLKRTYEKKKAQGDLVGQFERATGKKLDKATLEEMRRAYRQKKGRP